MKRKARSVDGRFPERAGAPSIRFPVLWSLVLCLPLIGCAGGDMSDLQSYVSQVLARKSRKIEPLPEIKPYEVYTYQSADKKDPFESFVQEEPEEPEQQQRVAGGISPDFNRNREELEQFPLDSLRMVGTVEKDQNMWGIILSSDGTVYRVQVGNYLGRNHGKIQNIMEDRMELTEIIPDGLGGWQEREATLALVE